MNELQVNFKKWVCVTNFGQYENGCTAILLSDKETGEPITKATVNLADGDVKEGEVAIKDYSENEGMLDALIEWEIVSSPKRSIKQGFVDVPICDLLVETEL